MNDCTHMHEYTHMYCMYCWSVCAVGVYVLLECAMKFRCLKEDILISQLDF